MKYIFKYLYFNCILICFNLSAQKINQPPILNLPFDNNSNDSINNIIGQEIGNIDYVADRFGNECSALYLNGIDAYVMIPHLNTFNSISSSFSICSWFKSDHSKNNNWLTLICKGDLKNETFDNPHFRAQVLQTDDISTVSISSDFTEYDQNFKDHLFRHDSWSFFTLT